MVGVYRQPLPADVIATLEEAGLMIGGMKNIKKRLPIYTNLLQTMKKVSSGTRLTPSETQGFFRDLVDAWRLNLFAVHSFTLDFVGNSVELSAQLIGGAGRDAVHLLKGNPTFPSLQGFMRAVRYRATNLGKPIPKEIEDAFGHTIGGELIRGGFRSKEGTFTLKQGKASTLTDQIVGGPLYLKGVFDTGFKRLAAWMSVERDTIEAMRLAGIKGPANRKAFRDSFQANLPKAVLDRAISQGNKAGFNRPLTQIEEKIASSTMVKLFAEVFARWPFQFVRHAGEMFGYNKVMIERITSGQSKAAGTLALDLGEYLAKSATGYGGLMWIDKMYDRVDFQSLEYVHPNGDRTRLANRDPIPSALFLLATIKGLRQDSISILDYYGRDENVTPNIAKAGGALRFASVPGGRVLLSLSGQRGQGGLLISLLQTIFRANERGEIDPRAFNREMSDIVNRLFPGQAVLSMLESIFDPTVREGIGANLPLISKFLPPAINRTTGEPLVIPQKLPLTDIEVPTAAGVVIPGARRVVGPVHKLVAFTGQLVYRGARAPIAGLHPSDVPRPLQREWEKSFGRWRTNLLLPTATELEKGDLAGMTITSLRETVMMLDTMAAKFATDEVLSTPAGQKELEKGLFGLPPARKRTGRELKGPSVYLQEKVPEGRPY